MGVSNTVQQLSVFLENRRRTSGRSIKMYSQKANVNIVALSLADII